MALLKIPFFDWTDYGSKGRCRFWLVMLFVAFFQSGAECRGQTESREYQVKAVFLFNFAQFVEWPPVAFPDEHSPLVIGVLGEDPFGSLLDETVRDEQIGLRPLVVQRYRRVQDIINCHVLFISRSETPHLESIAAALKGRSILTVSDADAAARRGVMIQLLMERKKIRLSINLEAAKLAGLTISSKLLRPAEIVTSPKN